LCFHRLVRAVHAVWRRHIIDRPVVM
jgi:hypothetical protein